MTYVQKRVATKGCASLKHGNVVKLLLCYANLRLLESHDKDMLNMVEDTEWGL